MLEVKGKTLFAPSRSEAVNRRKTVLQKPSQLPLEEDIKRLNDSIDMKLNDLDSITYRELRQLLVTRYVGASICWCFHKQGSHWKDATSQDVHTM